MVDTAVEHRVAAPSSPRLAQRGGNDRRGWLRVERRWRPTRAHGRRRCRREPFVEHHFAGRRQYPLDDRNEGAHRRAALRARRRSTASARRDQNSVCSPSQRCAIVNPCGRRLSQCSRPRCSRRTKPARSSTLSCRDTPAKVMGSGAARSVIRAGPRRSASNNRRRVGSANAAYVRSKVSFLVTSATLARIL